MLLINFYILKNKKLRRDREGRKYTEIYSGSTIGLAMPTLFFNGLKPLGKKFKSSMILES